MSLSSDILVLDLSSGSNLPPLPTGPDLQTQINGLQQSKDALLDEAWTYPAKSENNLSLRHQAKLVGTKIWRLKKLQSQPTYNSTTSSLDGLVALADGEMNQDNHFGNDQDRKKTEIDIPWVSNEQQDDEIELGRKPREVGEKSRACSFVEESDVVEEGSPGQEGSSNSSQPRPDKVQPLREQRPRKAKSAAAKRTQSKSSARYRTPSPPPLFEPTKAFFQSDVLWGDVYGIDGKLIGPAFVPSNSDNPGYVLVRPVRPFIPPTKGELMRPCPY